MCSFKLQAYACNLNKHRKHKHSLNKSHKQTHLILSLSITLSPKVATHNSK